MGNRKMVENVGTRQFIGRTAVELCQADYTHKNPHLCGRKNVHNSVDNVDKHGKTAEILNYLSVDNFFFMGKTGDEMCINKKKNIYIFFCKFSPDQRKNKKQECLGILAARCASCKCMTYFYCAPLQSCRRLYQLGDDSQLIYKCSERHNYLPRSCSPIRTTSPAPMVISRSPEAQWERM